MSLSGKILTFVCEQVTKTCVHKKITVFREEATLSWFSCGSSILVELEFGVLVFVEGGKLVNPEKNPRNKDENQQQTQPTYDAGSGNRTRATLAGGERSHHCANPAPPKINVVIKCIPIYGCPDTEKSL